MPVFEPPIQVPTNLAEWNRYFRSLKAVTEDNSVSTEKLVDSAVTPVKLSESYYTEAELDAGQLNTIYYTETELDAGQLDNRYYTESEIDALITAVSSTGSFTGTLTGCTTSPDGTLRYDISSEIITLYIPQINATSNTTAMTITGGPDAIKPARAHRMPFIIQDNGTVQLGLIEVGIDGVLTFYSSVSLAAFTGSGTKGVELQTISYSLN